MKSIKIYCETVIIKLCDSSAQLEGGNSKMPKKVQIWIMICLNLVFDRLMKKGNSFNKWSQTLKQLEKMYVNTYLISSRKILSKIFSKGKDYYI